MKFSVTTAKQLVFIPTFMICWDDLNYNGEIVFGVVWFNFGIGVIIKVKNKV